MNIKTLFLLIIIAASTHQSAHAMLALRRTLSNGIAMTKNYRGFASSLDFVAHEGDRMGVLRAQIIENQKDARKDHDKLHDQIIRQKSVIFHLIQILEDSGAFCEAHHRSQLQELKKETAESSAQKPQGAISSSDGKSDYWEDDYTPIN